MKTFFKNTIIAGLCGCMLMAGSCTATKNAWNGMTQTGQGASAGGLAGAALGTGIGALIGGGTWIGALVGGALGAGTGAVVGNAMQRQKNSLEKELDEMRQQMNENQRKDSTLIVQSVKDNNGLDAIKLVMGSAILFPTNGYELSPEADAVLARVAYNLKQYPETDVTVVGYTDNTGTQAINDKLSLERAQSVMNQLEADGISADRLKAIGQGWNDPIASNATAAGRAQNRRVEMYIYANQDMIQNAEKQAN